VFAVKIDALHVATGHGQQDLVMLRTVVHAAAEQS
jgi:hypothetical protein